ncbi:MAG: hypothetical protein LDL56_09050 [Armatimonadetes bacterium]|nr:hypothetical protein [Armatimonadota bacterium]MCA1997360.1 hypothetical protein [Armatimonadota bacterium]
MNRIVRVIGGEPRRISWLSGRKPDGAWFAVACLAIGDRPLIAVWEGDREPDDDDVTEAVRARLDEDARRRAGNSACARGVGTDMERSQTSIAINELDNLFRHAAQTHRKLATEFDPADPAGCKSVAKAMDAAADMAAFAAVALNDINDGSRRERAGLLRRVWDERWPGLKAVLETEASLWVELPDGWAISLQDGDAFWLSRDDLLDAAAGYLADRILDAEGWKRFQGNHPETPETPEVPDVQARDWAVDGLCPAGVEL